MVHNHSHSHDYCPFDHHSAEYNLCRIVMEMVLLEDHYVSNPCLDCMSKHLLKIASYASEGLNLDNASKWRNELLRALEIARSHMRKLAELYGRRGVREDLQQMAQELRAFRREVLPRLLGFGEVEHHTHEHVKEAFYFS